MIKINPDDVMEQRLAAGMGLNRYKTIMDKVRAVDVSEDAEFQRVFNGFYIVRRNEEWRKFYYDLFEKTKYDQTCFAHILQTLYEQTGNIEASFASKLFATINPDKPIWNRYVVQNLGIKVPETTKQEKLDFVITKYEEIEKWYSDFLSTDNARECIQKFDQVLPSYHWLSDIKKIDFYLWSIQ